jgi:hypothetical protein
MNLSNNTVEYLQKQYDHAFEMIKFGESKNTTLVAFNGAIIIGFAQLLNDTKNECILWYLWYAIGMCAVSVLISLCSFIAKIKHTTNNELMYQSDNLMFYATLACYDSASLILKLENEYGCVSSGTRKEEDIARQVIISSQIANRKFKYFNNAIFFTISGLVSPIVWVIYKLGFNNDK